MPDIAQERKQHTSDDFFLYIEEQKDTTLMVMHRNLRLVSLKATFFYALTCDCFFKTRLLHQGEKQRLGPLHEYLRSIVLRDPTFRHDKHTVTVHNRVDSMSNLSKRKPTPHQLNSKNTR